MTEEGEEILKRFMPKYRPQSWNYQKRKALKPHQEKAILEENTVPTTQAHSTRKTYGTINEQWKDDLRLPVTFYSYGAG